MQVYIYQNVCERRVVGYRKLVIFLNKNNVKITDDLESADSVLFFSCGMKIDASFEYIRKIQSLQKKIIVYGCAGKMLGLIETEYLIPINLYEYDKLNTLFNAKFRYQDIDINSEEKEDYLDISFDNAMKSWDPRLYMPQCKDVYSITISEGCSNNCSYCAIHFATGELKSRSIESIVSDFKKAISEGYRLFRLQCENSGSYGNDNGNSIGELLDSLGNIEDDFAIDLPDLHPAGFVNNIDSIIRFMKKKKIYLMHLPVQSGSQKILELMNRNYDINDVKKCLRELFRHRPDFYVGTDIIVGFPGEKEDDFEDSMDLLNEFRLQPIYIHWYSEKKGTAAYYFKDKVDESVIQDRIRRMYDQFKYAACYLNNYRGEKDGKYAGIDN